MGKKKKKAQPILYYYQMYTILLWMIKLLSLGIILSLSMDIITLSSMLQPIQYAGKLNQNLNIG